MQWSRNWPVLLFGTAFGWILSRSGAADYDFIQGMFLFDNLQLYGILAVAVSLTALGIRLLARHGRTAGGEAIKITPKPENPGTVPGAMLFGIGWAITGMCPGPIVVNIGEGKLYAFGALAGVVLGAYVVGVVRSYPTRRKKPRGL